MKNPLLEKLRYHISGAIDRGEKVAVTSQKNQMTTQELMVEMNTMIGLIYDEIKRGNDNLKMRKILEMSVKISKNYELIHLIGED